MELLDQYLRSVRSCLPAAQRDDIVSELSENIRAQIEDKEGELGRPLNEGELEAILKQHGHPLVVASRYRQDQSSVAFGRQIIGPVLFSGAGVQSRFNWHRYPYCFDGSVRQRQVHYPGR
jgi:hypothetical protein